MVQTPPTGIAICKVVVSLTKIEAEPLAIKYKASPDRHVSREMLRLRRQRLLAEGILGKHRLAPDSIPHFRGSTGKVDPNADLGRIMLPPPPG